MIFHSWTLEHGRSALHTNIGFMQMTMPKRGELSMKWTITLSSDGVGVGRAQIKNVKTGKRDILDELWKRKSILPVSREDILGNGSIPRQEDLFALESLASSKLSDFTLSLYSAPVLCRRVQNSNWLITLMEMSGTTDAITFAGQRIP